MAWRPARGDAGRSLLCRRKTTNRSCSGSPAHGRGPPRRFPVTTAVVEAGTKPNSKPHPPAFAVGKAVGTAKGFEGSFPRSSGAVRRPRHI